MHPTHSRPTTDEKRNSASQDKKTLEDLISFLQLQLQPHAMPNPWTGEPSFRSPATSARVQFQSEMWSHISKISKDITNNKLVAETLWDHLAGLLACPVNTQAKFLGKTCDTTKYLDDLITNIKNAMQKLACFQTINLWPAADKTSQFAEHLNEVISELRKAQEAHLLTLENVAEKQYHVILGKNNNPGKLELFLKKIDEEFNSILRIEYIPNVSQMDATRSSQVYYYRNRLMILKEDLENYFCEQLKKLCVSNVDIDIDDIDADDINYLKLDPEKVDILINIVEEFTLLFYPKLTQALIDKLYPKDCAEKTALTERLSALLHPQPQPAPQASAVGEEKNDTPAPVAQAGNADASSSSSPLSIATSLKSKDALSRQAWREADGLGSPLLRNPLHPPSSPTGNGTEMMPLHTKVNSIS